MIEELKKIFVTQFRIDTIILRAPGRINIIGEHTDYNDGFVLPASINKYSLRCIAGKMHLFYTRQCSLGIHGWRHGRVQQ